MENLSCLRLGKKTKLECLVKKMCSKVCLNEETIKALARHR